MDEIYAYIVRLPDGIDEIVVPCYDGHTVYLDERLDRARMLKKYEHAVGHIRGKDWEKDDVQSIESEVRNGNI